MTALSDFVASLEDTKWFRKPVEIIDSQLTTDAKTGDLVSSWSRPTTWIRTCRCRRRRSSRGAAK